MKLFYYITILFLAFLSTLLDTSYFSFLEIYYSTILISLGILISLAMLGIKKGTVMYATFLILFFTIFSSLQVWFLFSIFILIPLIVFYLNRRFAFDHSKILIILVFLFCNFLFQFSLAVISQDFSTQAFISVVSFTVINTILGFLIFNVLKMARKFISPFLEKM